MRRKPTALLAALSLALLLAACGPTYPEAAGTYKMASFEGAAGYADFLYFEVVLGADGTFGYRYKLKDGVRIVLDDRGTEDSADDVLLEQIGSGSGKFTLSGAELEVTGTPFAGKQQMQEFRLQLQFTFAGAEASGLFVKQ